MKWILQHKLLAAALLVAGLALGVIVFVLGLVLVNLVGYS